MLEQFKRINVRRSTCVGRRNTQYMAVCGRSKLHGGCVDQKGRPVEIIALKQTEDIQYMILALIRGFFSMRAGLMFFLMKIIQGAEEISIIISGCYCCC